MLERPSYARMYLGLKDRLREEWLRSLLLPLESNVFGGLFMNPVDSCLDLQMAAENESSGL